MKLEIINSERYFKTRKARNAAILLFITMMILMGGAPSEYRPGILQGLGIFDKVFVPFGVVFIVTGIYVYISYIYSRQSKKVGVIELNLKVISIDTKTYSQKIKIENIEFLKITHNTYVGEEYGKSPLNNYHGNNWILIKTKTEEKNLEFKIDSHYKNVQLKQLIDGLKSIGLHIEYEQI